MVEEFHRAPIVRVLFFFLAKLRRVRLPAAARELHRVFQVKHLVVEHIADDIVWNSGGVQLAIDDDLLERGIKAAELAAPHTGAPAKARLRKHVGKIPEIELREHGLEIVMRARRVMFGAATATLAQCQQPPAGGASVRKFAVNFEHFARRPSAIEPAEQNGGGGFEDSERSIAEDVGEADIGGIFAQTDGMREVRIGMIFHDEVRRAAFAS